MGVRRRREEEAFLHGGAGEDPPPRSSGCWASTCLTAVWGLAAAEFGRPTCRPAQPVHSGRFAPRSGLVPWDAQPRGNADVPALTRSRARSYRRGGTGSETAQDTRCAGVQHGGLCASHGT